MKTIMPTSSSVRMAQSACGADFLPGFYLAIKSISGFLPTALLSPHYCNKYSIHLSIDFPLNKISKSISFVLPLNTKTATLAGLVLGVSFYYIIFLTLSMPTLQIDSL